MTNKTLEELKLVLQPYLFFWDEWCMDENCNLQQDEILLINSYIASSFEIGVLESILFYNKNKILKDVIRKLTAGYQVFKDFVIVNFLFRIISMARKYGYRRFLETPVHQLEISERLKEILGFFKAYSLQQLFIIYKVEDFSRGGIFKKIVEFQCYVKAHEEPSEVTAVLAGLKL